MHKLMPNMTTNMTIKNANTSTMKIVFCDMNQTQLTYLTPIKQMLGGICNLELVE